MKLILDMRQSKSILASLCGILLSYITVEKDHFPEEKYTFSLVCDVSPITRVN